MSWDVEYTDEFGEWWDDLTIGEQESIRAYVGLLEDRGPNLPFPYCSKVVTSRHAEMRELRPQHKGEPYRILYAFDPRRTAILLLGGCKTGNDRWYEGNVPKADKIYDKRLRSLDKERD